MSDTSKPQFRRTLGPVELTLFGVTYMTIAVVFTTYGVVNQVTDGHLAAAYTLAIVAMLFTASSYATLARKYPVAGSAYTYTQQAFGGFAGFITGWVILLDYLFIPMINFMVIGIYLHTQYPTVPEWVFTIAALLLVLVFNLLGISFVNRANFAIIALSVLLVLVFMLLAFKQVLGGDTSVGLLEPFSFGEGGIGAIASGAAILSLSFLGFDAVSTLSEEAKNARRDIPRAIFASILVSGLLFVLVAWTGGLAYSPDWATLSTEDVDAAGVTLVGELGGAPFTAFFIAVYVVSSFGSAMTGQASVSRLLFAMGRDGVLPRPLARLHPRFGTPFIAVIVVSLLAMSSLVLDLNTAAFMISFGALAAFAMVNLSVMKDLFFSRQGREQRTLRTVLVHLVSPLIAFGLTVWLWTSLDPFTWIVGGIWILLGVVIIGIITRGFRRPVPKLDFSGDSPTTTQIDQLGETPAPR